ncbi:META and DUF4377 domain-containing protein [Aquitalea pelogenes]|uniref:META and DUF4377 domain-containing protein n=1 Tax=Aquitalea pelogenes TaxID=1293573 RepID=UPI00078898D9|nr:META and DUF4377 domain-containing protein [Aquitalea pelogenes]
MHWKTTAIIVALLSAPVLARPNLIGTDWQLVSPKVAEPQPTLSFQAKGISGFAGCNRFTGHSNAEGKLVIATTRMMCPPAMMQTEQAYVGFLSQPFQIKTDGKAQQLVLTGKAGDEYRFVRKQDKAAGQNTAATTPAQRPQYLYVSAVRKNCSAGAGQMQCLQVRSSENQPWQLFYGEIEGFTPQPDTAYYLKLRYETVANPPADASAVRTILERVVFSETVTRTKM